MRVNEKDWKFHMHAHKNSLELSLIIQGSGKLYTEGKIYPFHEGNIVIKDANILHGESADNGHPLEMIWMEIDGYQEKGKEPNHLLEPSMNPIIASGAYQEILQACFLKAEESFTKDKNKGIHDTLLRVIMIIIHDCLRRNSAVAISKSEEMIREVTRYLDMHYREPLTISEIADHFHLSESYLMHLFKKVTLVTINTYLMNCRIGEAERMLASTHEPIKEISVHCGFTTVQYFYKIFQQHIGMTPTAYRAIYQAKTIS